MKISYKNTIARMDNGSLLIEHNNCGHKWLSIDGLILTDKAREMLWKHDPLIDITGTELDTYTGSRYCVTHIYVRDH